LFNLTTHELHELCYDIGLLLILKEALDRLRVHLNMYLFNINTPINVFMVCILAVEKYNIKLTPLL